MDPQAQQTLAVAIMLFLGLAGFAMIIWAASKL